MLIPDHETAVDFLNYEAISTTIVELLKENRQRALTIGIHGDWGAGKSSVLKMVEFALKRDEHVACLWARPREIRSRYEIRAPRGFSPL